jgi:HEAT repeats
MAAGDSVLAPLFKQTSVKEAAAWAADPYDADKRARGTLLLANAPFGGAEPYLALYRQHALDKDTNVQAAACRGLALHGQPSDVDLIVPLTKSKEYLVRLEATRSLQRLHNPTAVPALVDRLSIEKETEPDIRAEAASALGQYAEVKSMQALIAALADPSLVVNVNAHDSLKTLTGNDELPAERRAWVQWQKQAAAPFAGRKSYVYPVFWREKRWLDWVPLVGGPVPNETASTPAGFPDLSGASGGGAGDGSGAGERNSSPGGGDGKKGS